MPKGPIDRVRDGFDKEPRRIDPHPLEEMCTNVKISDVFFSCRYIQESLRREKIT